MMRLLMRAGIATMLSVALLLAGCSLTGSASRAPALASAYDDLPAYWEKVAGNLGLDPSGTLLQEWLVAYGEGGAVRYLRLVLYVDRGRQQYDVYTVNQQRNGTASWRRSRINDSGGSFGVPADRFFAELSAAGYRQLEAHQAIAPPIRSWFRTISGEITYGSAVDTHLLRDGRLIAAGPNGVIMRGIHGTLQLTRDMAVEVAPGPAGPAAGSATTAARPGESPPMYLLPEVGCSPRSGASDAAEIWQCPTP